MFDVMSWIFKNFYFNIFYFHIILIFGVSLVLICGVPFFLVLYALNKEMILIFNALDWLAKNIFSILVGVVLCILTFLVISYLKRNKCNNSCSTCNKNCDFRKDE